MSGVSMVNGHIDEVKKEYIEREKLITELNNIALDLLKDNSIQCSLAAGTVVDIKDNIVAKQPTADVVEVVRCSKCKYCDLRYPAKPIGEEAIEGYYCGVNRRYLEPTDFCSYGERKDSL